MRRRLLGAAVLGATSPRWADAANAALASDFWHLLRGGGGVVLMRHAATEPGIGDPPNFRLGDCRTQRNLSDEGRTQARRVGLAFAAEGIAPPEVRASAWCRCIETAQLAFGAHRVWPAINSFFQSDTGAAQTREVRAALAARASSTPLVLVTHQVNITALTGEFPAMGELFLTRPTPSSGHALQVLARLVP